MPLYGIISGGQTGADQGGLRAAKALGLGTGGYAPKGWRTEDGPAPWLGTDYGLVEHHSELYEDRTETNIVIADGTVIFGRPSSGSNLTNRICHDLGKPKMWIHQGFRQGDPDSMRNNTRAEFRLWLERNKIQVLNVAGNRESRAKGIGLGVERFLREVLPLCR